MEDETRKDLTLLPSSTVSSRVGLTPRPLPLEYYLT